MCNLCVGHSEGARRCKYRTIPLVINILTDSPSRTMLTCKSEMNMLTCCTWDVLISNRASERKLADTSSLDGHRRLDDAAPDQHPPNTTLCMKIAKQFARLVMLYTYVIDTVVVHPPTRGLRASRVRTLRRTFQTRIVAPSSSSSTSPPTTASSMPTQCGTTDVGPLRSTLLSVCWAARRSHAADACEPTDDAGWMAEVKGRELDC